MSVEDVAKLPKKMRSLEDIIQRLEREAKIEICDAMVLIADWRKKKEALELARVWLDASLTLVRGEGPPNWDGIRDAIQQIDAS